MHEMRLAISEARNSERLSFQIRDGSPRGELGTAERRTRQGIRQTVNTVRFLKGREEHRRWGSPSIVLLRHKVRSSRRGTLRNRLQMGNVKPTR